MKADWLLRRLWQHASVLAATYAWLATLGGLTWSALLLLKSQGTLLDDEIAHVLIARNWALREGAAVLSNFSNRKNRVGSLCGRAAYGAPVLLLGLAAVTALVDLTPATAQAPNEDDSWLGVSMIDAPDPRLRHTAIWTGEEMLVWGGGNPFPLNDGGRYDPNGDAWRPIPPARPRAGHTAVWTGTEMVVFGGRRTIEAIGGGNAYDPSADAWRALPDQDSPSARDQHTAVWTGREMLIWGGYGCPQAHCGDGARYDPVADAWAPMTVGDAPRPRAGHTAVWTGTEMVVWGGGGVGSNGGGRLGDGARYSPSTDRWAPVAADSAPSPRQDHTAIWTGTEMLVWGGQDQSAPLGDGAAYNPATDSWQPLSSAGAPSPRSGHTAVWTGTAMLVWGGIAGSTTLGDGAAYNPATHSWRPLSATAAPGARQYHTAIWTGNRLLVWGGLGHGDALLTDGGRYLPPSGAMLPSSD